MAARSTIDDFEVLERLGHGTYGTVYRVVRRLDGQIYALKEIELEGMSEKARPTDGTAARTLPRGGIVMCVWATAVAPHPCALVPQEQQDCIQETRVLSSLSSPYIIKYYDSFLHDVSHARYRC